MGILSKLAAGVAPQKKAGDDVLLFHGMMLMAGADGTIEEKEQDTLRAFFFTLPEFAGKSFDQMLEQGHKLIHKYGGLQESIKSLGEITSPAVRKKLFVLATDLALSSGDIDETEEKLLESMQRLLAIDDALASKIIEVLSLKYAV
jgi:uncharacterized tellurite resistance protein B-like protein